ncbi:MAG: conserved exported protein of unknown function [Methanothrix sp.]|jgi:hypothetical protein|nr:MAG: conserved exported protein of unknown function [Methanothrix sp.]
MDMTSSSRSRKVAILGAFALLLGSLSLIADEVFGDSGITYEEGHPTAYGGVQGWNPAKSLETGFKIAYRYLQGRLNIG